MAAGPVPRGRGWYAVARCVATSAVMLARREVHLPREHVGQVIRFGDGTTGRVYRETRVDRAPVDPCLLVVAFRLRGVHGRGHTWFRTESLLNTPLFVGFPGFVSKLWLAHDRRGTYRGVYEWDGAVRAETYARSLWRVLELVSQTGSIAYRVFPGVGRDEVLADPAVLDRYPSSADDAWSRLVEAA